jgi:acetyl esterase
VLNNGPGQFAYKRVAQRFLESSPVHNVGPHAPPTVVFLGDLDALIPVRVLEVFEQ